MNAPSSRADLNLSRIRSISARGWIAAQEDLQPCYRPQSQGEAKPEGGVAPNQLRIDLDFRAANHCLRSRHSGIVHLAPIFNAPSSVRCRQTGLSSIRSKKKARPILCKMGRVSWPRPEKGSSEVVNKTLISLFRSVLLFSAHPQISSTTAWTGCHLPRMRAA